VLLAACGGPPLAPPPPAPVVAVAERSAPQAPASRPAARAEGVDPAVLLPRAGGRDDELARVGEVAFHKRDVADRLFEAEPAHAQQLLNDLRMDALVHAQVVRHGIVVEAAPIEALLAAEEKRLREQVERELAGRVGYEEYLLRSHGLSAEEFRRWQRTELARARYRHYVARYLALREDRVVARVLTNADRPLVEDLARRVAAGADFGTLAQRHSDDEETRQDGGLMVLARGSAHPVVGSAFALQPGQVSPVLQLTGEGPPRYALVYCVERRAGRDVDFASVRAEIDADLERNPMTRSEWQVLFQRLTSASENLPSTGGNR
jgi:hypothetical protein